MPSAVEAWSLNHWAAREVPRSSFISEFHCTCSFSVWEAVKCGNRTDCQQLTGSLADLVECKEVAGSQGGICLPVGDPKVPTLLVLFPMVPPGTSKAVSSGIILHLHLACLYFYLLINQLCHIGQDHCVI